MEAAAIDHKALDYQVVTQLTRYGAAETFNAALTLVATAKTCTELDTSLATIDNAVDLLEGNPWVVGILEAAFHLKVFRFVRELPVLRSWLLKIELLQEEDLDATQINVASQVTSGVAAPAEKAPQNGSKSSIHQEGCLVCDYCRNSKQESCLAGAPQPCQTCKTQGIVCSGRQQCSLANSQDRTIRFIYSDLRLLFDHYVAGEGHSFLSESESNKDFTSAMRNVRKYITQLGRQEDAETCDLARALIREDFGAALMFQLVHRVLREEGYTRPRTTAKA